MKRDKTADQLSQIAEKFIKDYKAKNGTQNEPHPQFLRASSRRTGAINIEATNESAEILLHQLANLAKSGVEEPAEERLEVGPPPMLVIAKRVKTFVMFFCGFKNDKPVWCYGTDHLAQQLKFNEAEEISAQLGEGAYALPAPERRKVQRKSF